MIQPEVGTCVFCGSNMPMSELTLQGYNRHLVCKDAYDCRVAAIESGRVTLLDEASQR